MQRVTESRRDGRCCPNLTTRRGPRHQQDSAPTV